MTQSMDQMFDSAYKGEDDEHGYGDPAAVEHR